MAGLQKECKAVLAWMRMAQMAGQVTQLHLPTLCIDLPVHGMLIQGVSRAPRQPGGRLAQAKERVGCFDATAVPHVSII